MEEPNIIRNEPNNVLTRFPCSLCHGATEKQDYLFHLPNGGIVCDECARSPEAIPARLRAAADQLRETNARRDRPAQRSRGARLRDGSRPDPRGFAGHRLIWLAIWLGL